MSLRNSILIIGLLSFFAGCKERGISNSSCDSKVSRNHLYPTQPRFIMSNAEEFTMEFECKFEPGIDLEIQGIEMLIFNEGNNFRNTYDLPLQQLKSATDSISITGDFDQLRISSSYYYEIRVRTNLPCDPNGNVFIKQGLINYYMDKAEVFVDSVSSIDNNKLLFHGHLAAYSDLKISNISVTYGLYNGSEANFDGNGTSFSIDANSELLSGSTYNFVSDTIVFEFNGVTGPEWVYANYKADLEFAGTFRNRFTADTSLPFE